MLLELPHSIHFLIMFGMVHPGRVLPLSVASYGIASNALASTRALVYIELHKFIMTRHVLLGSCDVLCGLMRWSEGLPCAAVELNTRLV